MKLTCIKCGLVWAVSSKYDKMGPYICPRCARRKEKMPLRSGNFDKGDK